VRDFAKGSSLNPYSTPPRRTWGTGGGLTSLHIVVGYGRRPDADLLSGGRIRRRRHCASWWPWPCARCWCSAPIRRPPDEQGRTPADALRGGDRRWGGLDSGEGDFFMNGDAKVGG
jgi:hypothetical protein